MKKLSAFTLAGALLLMLAYVLLSAGAAAATADSLEISVYVTVTSGKIDLALKKITVTDIDGDGVLSVYDALYAAHEDAFEGGAEEGFATSDTSFGKAISKLWGFENGGSYGYYVNHAMAMSLADEVSEGDTVSAFAYADTLGFSDTYCYFNMDFARVKVGETVSLVLYAAGFDENWESVVLPVKDAVITVNGEETGWSTDGEGRGAFTLDKPGPYLVSATLAGQAIVPPVCAVTAENSTPSTADSAPIVRYVILALLCAAAAVSVPRRQKFA